MDLKAYYAKVREAEAKIKDDYVIVVSKETGDGGRPGAMTEVRRSLAAKLLVEGKIRLATEEEKQKYRKQREEARRRAEKRIAASKLQLMVLTTDDLKKLTEQKHQRSKD